MTRPELRVLLNKWWCGCGLPEEACAALFRLLSLHPLHSNRDEFKAWITDTGVEMLLLYTLDRLDLTEHGGSVGGGWLTATGESVREALRREQGDNYETLTASACMHGYAVDSDELLDCPECGQ